LLAPSRRTLEDVEALPPTVQVVAQTTHPCTYVLDAIGGGVGAQSGHPIALVLARPETCWFDAAIERLLRVWAEDGRVLNVHVRRGARKDVAVLEPQGGDSTLRLDLMAVA
jgi:hypothetical protein